MGGDGWANRLIHVNAGFELVCAKQPLTGRRANYCAFRSIVIADSVRS
jgi:hypothetical protein